MSLVRPLESTSGRRSSSRTAAFRRLAVAVTLPAALVGSALVTGSAAHADVPAGPGSITQHYSDGFLAWTVPFGTSSVTVTAVGGSGGHGSAGPQAGGAAGGNGSLVAERVSVVPGEVLYLFPGSAASGSSQGSSTGADSRFGGSGGEGDGSSGGGGGGGAATEVRKGTDTLVVAGGGGGGGGGGTAAGNSGGAGGTGGTYGAPGSGPGGGQGGSGFVTGTSTYQNGQHGFDPMGGSNAAGGGGGGAGWDGRNSTGGRGGLFGWLSGGAGGGGAGGSSYASDPNAPIAAASSPGDGYVTLAWTPGVATTSTLSAPASVPQGTAATLTDTIAPALIGGPSPTGSVTFEDVDIYTYERRVLGVVPVSNGQATLNADLGAFGQHAVHAIYSGDSTNQPSTSDFVYPTVVVPDVMTLAVSPSPVTFGNRVLGGSVSAKTITLTNTGTVTWNLVGFSWDNDALWVTSSCLTLAPGASCTALVGFQPRVLGPVSATVSFDSNFGTTSVRVTGAGIASKPVVTAISPHTGRKAGGTVVTITGRNLTGVTAIRVGTVAMRSVSCPSATRCTAVTPRGTGIKDIRVVTAGGTSAVVAADRFTYV
jgi:hypothetical protein